MHLNIKLDLSKHCIETEVKRLHDGAISAYFRAEGDKQPFEQAIVSIRYALESIDFARLRVQYPPLAGNTNLHVSLSVDDSMVTVSLDGKAIGRFGEKSASSL